MSETGRGLVAGVVGVLERRVDRGNTYVKTARVADDLPDASPKQVSIAMQTLEDRGVIERWSGRSTPVTWQIDADVLGGEADA